MPARGHVVETIEVVTDDTEIVEADVRELRAARNLADRPNAGRGRLQSIVDLDESVLGQFDAS